MNNPKDLMYTKSHEWIAFSDDGSAKVGLTDYAQNALGGLVFVNLPEEGDAVTKGESCADVESVKAVSEIFSPVTGEIISINEEIMDSPEKINEAPYEAWLFEVGSITDKEDLLSAGEYEAFCAAEEE